MTLPPGPSLTSVSWALWLARFPELPERNRHDLTWTRNRLAERLADFPTLLPSPAERTALRRWLGAYAIELDLDQRDDLPLIDPLAVVGAGSGMIGLAAAWLVPPLTIGAFIVSAGLLGKSIANNWDARQRAELVKHLMRLLSDIDRKL